MSSARSRPHVRAVFLDIDGTVLGQGGAVTGPVRDAIHRAQASGRHVVLCTGRTRHTAQPVAEELGLTDGFLIVSNGAIALDLRTDDVLWRDVMDREAALAVVALLAASGVAPYVFEDSVDVSIETSRVLYPPDFEPGPFAVRPRYRPWPGLLDALPFDPVTVSGYGPATVTRPLARRLRAEAEGRYSVHEVGTAERWGVEMLAPGVSKGAGIRALAERLGIAREETMAIGDHHNDVEMLRWAGLGVAMGNAVDEALDAADHVTGTVDEDGVAAALHRHVLAPA